MLDFIKSNKKKVIIAGSALLVLIAAVVVLVCLSGKKIPSGTYSTVTGGDPIKETEPVISAPSAVLGGFITPGADFPLDDKWQGSVDSMLDMARDNRFNCIAVTLLDGNGVYYASKRYGTSDSVDYVRYIADAAHDRSMLVYIAVDPSISPDGVYDLSDEVTLHQVTTELTNACVKYKADGVILYDPKANDLSYENYAKYGGSMGYEQYREQSAGLFVRNLCSELRKSGAGACVGLSVSSDRSEYAGNLAQNGSIDFAVVTGNSTDVSDGGGFFTVTDKWLDLFKNVKPLYFLLDASSASSGNIEQNTLLAQTEYLITCSNNGFLLDRLSVASKLPELTKRLSSIVDESLGIHEFTVMSPSSTDFTTYTDSVNFIGSFDPQNTLICNGKEVKHTDTGYFSFDAHLEAGNNTFTFEYNGQQTVYNVKYKRTLIKSVFPTKNQTCNGGTTVTVSAIALDGSKLTARIGNDVKEMVCIGGASNDAAETFSTYIAEFSMPQAQSKTVEVGKLTVSATNSGESQTVTGGKFSVRAISTPSDSSKPEVTPVSPYHSGYGIKVGEGNRYVAEVCVFQTETLDVITPTDERSRPTNAYLPMGTVDYCTDADAYYYNPESGNTIKFRTLDYGKRVYSDNNIKIFKATLPETNSITAVDCKNTGKHTVITFDTAWKAPFNVTLAPQTYNDPYRKNGRPDYSVSDLTYEYVDIEFCYTQSGQGAVSLENDPVFSKAEWVKGDRGYYVLRLWLREKGKFYGWCAEYNENDQLQFYFLNPAKITPTSGYYGYSLDGVKIVVDAGHGGKSSPGAVGSSKQYTEAVLNLILSKKVQRELENLGATVVMTRTSDVTMSLTDRNKITVGAKPDLFISIHRNSSTSSSTVGYEDFYFFPFSKPLADAVYNNSLPYFSNGRNVQFYPFNVTRMSCCPSILTENGFMSNSGELEMIISDDHNEKMAVAITKGIIEYLVSIQ